MTEIDINNPNSKIERREIRHAYRELYLDTLSMTYNFVNN